METSPAVSGFTGEGSSVSSFLHPVNNEMKIRADKITFVFMVMFFSLHHQNSV
jgi:hypothetical protein